MKKIWILLSRLFGYNQVKENDAKGYILFEKIKVEDKSRCDICGYFCTYGDGKTWARCFTHLNIEPKPKIYIPSELRIK